MSQSEGWGKMALGIVKIYLGSPFSANRRCLQSVCLRSVCRGQLLWTLLAAILLNRADQIDIRLNILGATT